MIYKHQNPFNIHALLTLLLKVKKKKKKCKTHILNLTVFKRGSGNLADINFLTE